MQFVLHADRLASFVSMSDLKLEAERHARQRRSNLSRSIRFVLAVQSVPQHPLASAASNIMHAVFRHLTAN
jgi:hypothetical protein